MTEINLVLARYFGSPTSAADSPTEASEDVKEEVKDEMKDEEVKNEAEDATVNQGLRDDTVEPVLPQRPLG